MVFPCRASPLLAPEGNNSLNYYTRNASSVIRPGKRSLHALTRNSISRWPYTWSN